MRHRLEGAFADAVARASHDPFVPYENATGIVNLAECSTSNGGGMGAGAGGGWDDPPEGTVDEVVIATVRELEGLFGQGGVEATAFNPADGGGLGPGSPASLEGEGFQTARLLGRVQRNEQRH